MGAPPFARPDCGARWPNNCDKENIEDDDDGLDVPPPAVTLLSPVVAVEDEEAEGAAPRTEAIAESNAAPKVVVMVALRGTAGVPWAVLVVPERAGGVTMDSL